MRRTWEGNKGRMYRRKHRHHRKTRGEYKGGNRKKHRRRLMRDIGGYRKGDGSTEGDIAKGKWT